MRVLQVVEPSAEQMPIVLNDRAGVAVLRGAAGSGKTTTALLRLKQLCRARMARRHRLSLSDPVRVLVLTFNRSLAGYISELADAQVPTTAGLDLTVSTFASWAQSFVGHFNIMSPNQQKQVVGRLGFTLSLTPKFMVDEVGYALGRFEQNDLDQYAVRDRDGRGTAPRVDKQAFLAHVLRPYVTEKSARGLYDWHDLAEMAKVAAGPKYDIIIIDEAQDFTTNQLRAVLAHQAADASVTLILDTVQRIYPSFFTWREAGLDASRFVLNSRLTENRRNTKEVAAFALAFVDGMDIDENGQLPDLTRSTTSGPLPDVFAGPFSEQSARIIDKLRSVDLARESVAILHPLGGGWFDTLRRDLQAARIDFVELTRNRDWPTGSVNVGLCTLHSAKGLEFDHVIVCGVTGETAAAPDDDNNTTTQTMRRLLAMAFGRAKLSILLCHDPSKPASVLKYLRAGTYRNLV